MLLDARSTAGRYAAGSRIILVWSVSKYLGKTAAREINNIFFSIII